MTRKWAHWTVVALAATLVAVAAQAKETEAEQPQTQVEVRMQQPGEEPAARIWINGKEVKPGEPISADALGQINVQTFVDTDGAEGGKAGAGASSGQVSVRVEARADKPGEQPKVRMWVNGKEVDPGKDVELDDKGQVRAYSFARPGRKRDEDSDKGGGVLGVMISPLDEETAEKADVKAGAVVRGTTPGSAAEKAGLKEGDVITRVDSRRIETPQQLADYIGQRRPGDRVRLEWSRDGRRMRETVVLGKGEARPPRSTVPREQRQDEPRTEPPPRKDEPERAFLGVMAASLTDEMREIAGTDTGVLINSLTDDSPAAKGGLQPGDVVTHVDDREIGGPDELVEAIRAHKAGDRVTIRYYRMGKRRQAQVALGEPPRDLPRHTQGMPLLNDLFGNMPQLREYLEKLQPDIEQWAKQWGEQQGKRRPPIPAPRMPGTKPEREPYDVGKDMGRILERLERIERRLDEMERRLERSDR